eukprot:PhM_4_TR16524/c0_g1_i1/m.40713
MLQHVVHDSPVRHRLSAAVERALPRRGLRALLHLLDGVLQVLHQALDHALACVLQREGTRDARGELQRHERPALVVEVLEDAEDVHLMLQVAAYVEGDAGAVVRAIELQLRHRLDEGRELPRDADNGLGVAAVPVLAEVHHGGPRARDDVAGARAHHARRGVDAARPLRRREHLVAAQLGVLVHEHRGALRGAAVLVCVAGDGRDAVDGEVELQALRAELVADVGHNEAAEAAVDVQPDAPRFGDLGELGDGVHGAAREARRRADDGDGVGRHEAAEVLHVHAPGGVVHARLAELDAEVAAGLVEGGVPRQTHDELRLRDPLLLACPLAVALHRHEDALGATAGDDAAHVGAAAVHPGAHGHDLRLHQAHPSEGVDVQWVRPLELRADVVDEGRELRRGQVDAAAEDARLPRHVHLAVDELGAPFNLRGREALLREGAVDLIVEEALLRGGAEVHCLGVLLDLLVDVALAEEADRTPQFLVGTVGVIPRADDVGVDAV